METARTSRLKGYFNEVKFALADGEGPVLRESREMLSKLDLSGEEARELAELDVDVVDTVLQFDEIADYLLNDDASQPLEHWWWHLGRIRRGEYPVDCLPESLRGLYRPHSRAA